MRGVYKAKVSISALAAAKTLMYLTAPANRVVEIIGASITNADNETNEQLLATLQRVGTLGAPAATTLTPSKSEENDQASASTVKGNVTASEPTYSADTELGYNGFSSQAGWFFDPAPEERPTVAGGSTLGLRLLTSTFTALNVIVEITYREIG